MNSLSIRQGVALWLALVLAAIVAGFKLAEYVHRRQQREHGQAALAADTVRASQDTSRVVTDRALLRELGDSLRAVQRLVIQRRQQQDGMDRALDQQRIMLAAIGAQVRGLAATVESGRTSDSAGTRRAHFDVRQAPYTVSADVRLPEPPAAGVMAVAVNLDSAVIGLRVGCTRPNPAGIRSATATATGPTWLPLTVGRVEQDPGLCASPALAQPNRAWWRALAPHLSMGYGANLLPDGTVRVGPQLGVSIDLWRPFR